MSVISRALKTAQKEKDQRAGGFSAAGGTPLIVNRRSSDGEPFNWRNAATIAISIVVIVGASWSMWSRMKKLNPPSTAMPIAVAQPQSSTAPAATPPTPIRTQPDDAPRELVPREQAPAPASRSVARAPVTAERPAGAVRRAPAAVSETSVIATAPPLREPLPAGRLRIAVEQPLEGDVARLFAAGVAAHRVGDFRSARGAYERVLLARPNDVDALNNLGVVLAATGDLDAGESMLRRAVRLAPRHVGAWNNLGTVLAQRAQHGDAIAAFQQALLLDPQHQSARVSLAQQYLAVSAADKAREVLDEVLASNPAMPEAHYALGQAYEMERNWAAAIRAYSAFVRVAPARMAADVDRVQQRIQMLAARQQ